MFEYIVRRLLISIPVILGISLIAFVLINLAPGSALDILIDPNAPQEVAIRQREELGMDRPIIIQYFSWLKQVFRGNLGYSILHRRPVLDMILVRIGPTFILGTASLLLALVIAVPVGVLSATRTYSMADYSSMIGALLTVSIPNFFLGLLLIYVFAARLHWLPVGGMRQPGSATTILSILPYIIMPAIALGARHTGIFMRFVRNGTLEVLHEDYIRTARSKGLSERVVIYKHALRNALIPLITLIGLSIRVLVGGAVVVERVFSWPGIGTLMIRSINQRDFPVVTGIAILVAIGVMLGNLLADITYGIVDPTIRYD